MPGLFSDLEEQDRRRQSGGLFSDLEEEDQRQRGGMFADLEAQERGGLAGAAHRSLQYNPLVKQAAFARSGLGMVGNAINRLLGAQTEIEHEFMPETREYDEMVRGLEGKEKARWLLSNLAGAATGVPTTATAAGDIWATEPTGEVLSRSMGAMGRGLKGEDQKYTSDIWAERYGLPETRRGRVGRGAGGFLVDLLRDPVTYLDFGMLTKGGRVAKAMGELAPDTAAQAAKGQRALVKFMGQPVVKGEKAFKPLAKAHAGFRRSAIGKGTDELFLRGSRNQALNQLLNVTGSAQGERRALGQRFGWDIAHDLDDLALKTGRAPADLRAMLSEGIEQGSREATEAFFERELPDVAADMSAHGGKWIRTMETALGEQLAHGAKMGDLGPGYVSHYFTDAWTRAQGVLQSSPWYKQWTEMHGAMNERILTAGYTIAEFNDIMATRGLKGVLPDLPEELNFAVAKALHDDAAYIGSRYLQGAARAVSGEELFRGIREMDDVIDISARAPQELAGLGGYRGIENVPELAGFAAPLDLADDIERTTRMIRSPGEINRFMQWFDTSQNWWKAWTLAPFPAYHTRNVVGNMWNSFLAGVKDPTVFHDAARMEMALWEPSSAFGRHFKSGSEAALRNLEGAARAPFRRGTRELDDIAGRYGFGSFDELSQAAHSRGVLGRGWMAAEIPHEGVGMTRLGDVRGLRGLQDTRLGRWRPGVAFGRESVPIRGGMTVGTIMENNARLGLFLDATRKNVGLGVDLKFAADDAAMTVKKFLFDYTAEGTTHFERYTLKRLMPFYTWTRNNVPLQLEYLLKKPRKMGAISKAHAAWQQGIGPGPTEKYLEDWKTEAAPWRIWGTPQKSTHLMMERYLPAADLTKLLDPVGTAQDLLTPFVKLPLELAQNYSWYQQRPINDYDWQQRKLLGVDMDPKLAYSMRQLRPVSEADWLLKGIKGETPRGESLVRLLTGKAYPYDMAKSLAGRWWELDEEERALLRELDRNPERADELVDELRAIYERY